MPCSSEPLLLRVAANQLPRPALCEPPLCLSQAPAARQPHSPSSLALQLIVTTDPMFAPPPSPSTPSTSKRLPALCPKEATPLGGAFSPTLDPRSPRSSNAALSAREGPSPHPSLLISHAAPLCAPPLAGAPTRSFSAGDSSRAVCKQRAWEWVLGQARGRERREGWRDLSPRV